MILGNLYREKGQVGKAITVHQALLQRPQLSRLEHAYVLLCLGLDYKRGGFVDRALEAFNEVLRLDPKNEYALVNLQKLHEEQHQWTEAYDTRQRLTKLAAIDSRPQSQAILAFLENEIGLEAMRRKDYPEAIRRFQAAIDLDARAVPAYLNLGDVRVAQGNETEAARHLGDARRRSRPIAPTSRSIGSKRWPCATGNPERFTQLCRRLIDENPQDWRARLALSRHLAASGQPQEALDLLFAALVQNPHALSIHQAIWRALGQLRHPDGARRPLRRADRARRLLPRPARLHALPLPQHRAALAVPALPRLEHVRRGADRAGAGHRRSWKPRGDVRSWSGSAVRQLASSDCAAARRDVAIDLRVRSPRTCRRCRMTKSARAAFSSGRHLRRQALVARPPRSARARAAAASCIAGETDRDDDASRSPLRGPSRTAAEYRRPRAASRR